MKRTRPRRRRSPIPHPHLYATQIGHVFHSWLRDRPVGRAERSWLDAALALALEHAILLHGPDAHESHAMTLAVVGRAAEQIWIRTDGAPRWAALDVEAAVDRWAPHGDALFVDTVVWTLAAFVRWLADTAVLTADEVLPLDRQLDPYLHAAMRSIVVGPVEHAVN